MLKKYEKLNYKAKSFFNKKLNDIIPIEFDKQTLERCHIEINILYEKGLLFIIEYLYKYRLENPKVKYHFKGTLNNLLLLHLLHLNEVNPLEYNLPYELFTDKKIEVYLTNGSSIDLVKYPKKCSYDFELISGNFEKDDIKEINEIEKNNYLIIPSYHPKNMPLKINKFGILETIKDYRNYKDKFLIIKIETKNYITDYQVVGIKM